MLWRAAQAETGMMSKYAPYSKMITVSQPKSNHMGRFKWTIQVFRFWILDFFHTEEIEGTEDWRIFYLTETQRDK